MTIRLKFVKETDLARLYQFSDNTVMWIPKIVVKSTTKFPSKDPLDFDIHELNIEDWWAEKNL